MSSENDNNNSVVRAHLKQMKEERKNAAETTNEDDETTEATNENEDTGNAANSQTNDLTPTLGAGGTAGTPDEGEVTETNKTENNVTNSNPQNAPPASEEEPNELLEEEPGVEEPSEIPEETPAVETPTFLEEPDVGEPGEIPEDPTQTNSVRADISQIQKTEPEQSADTEQITDIGHDVYNR